MKHGLIGMGEFQQAYLRELGAREYVEGTATAMVQRWKEQIRLGTG